MNDPGSLYDQFSGNEAPVYETSSKPFEPRNKETPHQNREDMSKPYVSHMQSKAYNAPTDDVPQTSAATSFWRYFTRQMDNNIVAQKVNSEFNRNALTDYEKEKEAYIKRYNELLNE